MLRPLAAAHRLHLQMCCLSYYRIVAFRKRLCSLPTSSQAWAGWWVAQSTAGPHPKDTRAGASASPSTHPRDATVPPSSLRTSQSWHCWEAAFPKPQGTWIFRKPSPCAEKIWTRGFTPWWQGCMSHPPAAALETEPKKLLPKAASNRIPDLDLQD